MRPGTKLYTTPRKPAFGKPQEMNTHASHSWQLRFCCMLLERARGSVWQEGMLAVRHVYGARMIRQLIDNAVGAFTLKYPRVEAFVLKIVFRSDLIANPQ